MRAAIGTVALIQVTAKFNVGEPIRREVTSRLGRCLEGRTASNLSLLHAFFVMLSVPYKTVDVFTGTPFSGNPLAVILNAQGLSETIMQRIAVEFNYSEVTFVCPPENPKNTARVRIFTPTCEVPFAGHPNVGTAFVLGQETHLFGRRINDTMRFEERAGVVEVTLIREHGIVVGATIKAPEPLTLGPVVEPSVVAECVSLGVNVGIPMRAWTLLYSCMSVRPTLLFGFALGCSRPWIMFQRILPQEALPRHSLPI